MPALSGEFDRCVFNSGSTKAFRIWAFLHECVFNRCHRVGVAVPELVGDFCSRRIQFGPLLPGNACSRTIFF